MWSCGWTEKINYTDRVKHEKVSYIRVKKEKDILRTVKRIKSIWICHFLCRNCLLRNVIARNIEGTRRGGGRCKQLLDNLKGVKRNWNIKDKILPHRLCRSRYGRGYGPVAGQIMYWNKYFFISLMFCSTSM